MSTWRIDRLTKEFVGPIVLTRNAVAVTGWTYTLLPRSVRPATTGAIATVPDTLSGAQGILVGPGTANVLTPGNYNIWIRFVDIVEAPVFGPYDFEGIVIVT